MVCLLSSAVIFWLKLKWESRCEQVVDGARFNHTSSSVSSKPARHFWQILASLSRLNWILTLTLAKEWWINADFCLHYILRYCWKLRKYVLVQDDDAGERLLNSTYVKDLDHTPLKTATTKILWRFNFQSTFCLVEIVTYYRGEQQK